MDELEVGCAVMSVDDRRIGEVAEIRDCCFAVRANGGKTWSLMPYVIFNIADRRVSLVCNESELDRYVCSNHR